MLGDDSCLFTHTDVLALSTLTLTPVLLSNTAVRQTPPGVRCVCACVASLVVKHFCGKSQEVEL